MLPSRAACLVFTVTVSIFSAIPARADVRHDARQQTDFAVQLAQHGLWREAIYRWQRAVEIDPTYAAAYNNLGIGYEHEGELDKARLAYEKALTLAPNDQQIRQNYELFKEINERVSNPRR